MKLKCSCHCILVKRSLICSSITCAYFLMTKLTFQTEISLAVHSKPVLFDLSVLCFMHDKKCFCVILFYIDLLARSGFSKVIFQQRKPGLMPHHIHCQLNRKSQIYFFSLFCTCNFNRWLKRMCLHMHMSIYAYMCLLESPSFELSIGGISVYDLLVSVYCA